MRHDLVAVSGSSARAMAPKRKYDAARLEEAVQKAVEAHKEELEKRVESARGADFELSCRSYF